ncbi:Flagellum-specific peptidoglycan hydrolase FlgJ [Psychroflexus halocasei]|uniref:Peptidoglycan hydrolase n=2 Tax=Psychroflexus halocasei TaxID=908615 RepID=A0A1H3YPN0_9FLAO|nr:glucosaminidase domain-containing protein [Psychroflexus halocasei]SEA12982.1 Flagellum-specific peptidoglycan hydrolase FlgJ [Psychroflexus halocasei]
MMKRTLLLSLLVIAFALHSCGAKKNASKKSGERPQPKETVQKQVPHPVSEKDYDDPKLKEETKVVEVPALSAVEQYIYNFAGIAQEEMRLYGIPASITLAQGILESGSGKGDLTRRSNNHFGIKCNGWQGEKVYHDDDTAQECFRKYIDPKYSFRDHSLFLYERSRYAFLFDYKRDDYKSWARGLKRAGYATDPRYPQKLISLIERYDLHNYDLQVIGKSEGKDLPRPRKITHDKNVHHVRSGDTLYGIAEKYHLSVERIKKLNNLKSNHLSIGQILKLK